MSTLQQLIIENQERIQWQKVIKRELVFDYQVFDLQKIVSIVWPRRARKTYFMYQMIQHLIQSGTIWWDWFLPSWRGYLYTGMLSYHTRKSRSRTWSASLGIMTELLCVLWDRWWCRDRWEVWESRAHRLPRWGKYEKSLDSRIIVRITWFFRSFLYISLQEPRKPSQIFARKSILW